MTDKQLGKQPKETPLIPYQFKPGVSGNPKGRPKGKTMKEFARDFLMSMTDEDKVKFMNSLSLDIVWRMAEGNPENKIDLTSKGDKIEGINYIVPDGTDNNKADKETTPSVGGTEDEG